jgi:hypothetical protein
MVFLLDSVWQFPAKSCPSKLPSDPHNGGIRERIGLSISTKEQFMHSFRRLIAIALSFTFVLGLVACASSAIVIGKVRPAISPDQVKIFLHPPKKYEEIAALESSSKNSWSVTSQGKMDVVIQRLKEEAAKLGANGVLLQGTGNEYGGSVSTSTGTATVSGNTAFGTGFGTSVGVVHKAGSGIAIFVEEELRASDPFHQEDHP